MKKRVLFTMAVLATTLSITTTALAGSIPGKETFRCKIDDTLTFIKGDSPFVGIYDGMWAGKLSHTLIVRYVVSSGQAGGWYAHGAYGRNIPKGGCWVWIGEVTGNELRFTLRNGAELTYKLVGDTLSGVYTINGKPTYGEFNRITIPLPNNVSSKIQ